MSVAGVGQAQARLLAALLLAGGLVAAWVAYRPALEGGFYFDDLPGIVEAPARHWRELSWAHVVDSMRSGPSKARPVANASFGLDHLAGGLEPRGYHLTNLLIHLLAGLGLAWAAALYGTEGVAKGRGERTAPVAAALAAAVFLAHPLNTQAVSYVVQRMSSLAALFAALAFATYLLGRRAGPGWRRGGLLGLAGLLWLLAVGSKENALVLPLVLATWEACFHGGTWRRRLVSWWADRRARAWLLLGVAGACVGIWWLVGIYPIWAEISLADRLERCECTGLERMLTQSRVHLLYLSLLAWPAPSRLNLDHDFTASRSLLEPPATLAAVAVWAGVLCLALFWARERPRWGFPVLAYFELHAMESGPIDLDLVFEHRMYLPTMALALLATAVAVDLGTIGRRLLLGGLAAAVVPLALATHQRNLVWADPIALHRDVAAKSPDEVRPQYNLGTVLGQAGRFAEAEAALRRAIELDPESSPAHNQLGSVHLSTGDVAGALAEYKEAVRLDPGNAEAVFNLALALERSGEYGPAAEAYRRFLAIAPAHLEHARPRAEAQLRWLSSLLAAERQPD